jgi:tetratricopeptide (TPR) repeat protein
LAVDLGRFDRYLCVMFRALLIILLLAAPAATQTVQAAEASPTRPAEYMIYQYSDVSLLVKIDAPETEFESKIYGPEDALLTESGLPGGRMGSLYQFIEAVGKPRQLMIKVSPGRKVDRSSINMEVIQVSDRDRNSAALAQAYKLLSQGTERVHSNDTTTWAMKTYTLRNAASAFARLGWEEMQLWSEFYAAHLVLHKLNDELMAMERAREVQLAAKRAGFRTIELAALILESDAVMRAGLSASGKMANTRFEQAHSLLDRIILLADQQGYRSEQARALYSDGLAYEQQDRLDDAVRQYQRALDVSLSVDDSELTNEIRSTAATAYETLGSTAGAIEMLDDIGSELDRGAEQELADNLYEKGRLLNRAFRYPEAAKELSQALALQKANPGIKPWGPTGLALAWSTYSSGDMAQATDLILEAIPRTPQGSNSKALIRAFDSLAQIYRNQGEYEQMDRFRQRQGRLAGSGPARPEFLFESALDAWHQGGSSSSQVRNLLVQSQRAAAENNDRTGSQRADLYLCLLQAENGGGSSCTSAKIRSSYEALRKSSVPKLMLEAAFVRAKILRREGRGRDALTEIEGLTDELLFFRQSLPGVAGAWYWQNKASIFQEYMAIVLTRPGIAVAGKADGARALLALDRIRLIEGQDQVEGVVEGITGEQDSTLRALIARLETADGDEIGQLASRTTQELSAFRATFRPGLRPLDAEALDRLLAGFAADECLLTYYFGKNTDYALLGKRGGVSLIKLSGRKLTAEWLETLREQAGLRGASLIPDLDSAGRLLLQPFKGSLARRIYLLPAGPLNGFPLDLLRLDGQFLALEYEVVNLMTLAAAGRRQTLLPDSYRQQVFLAGDPQTAQQLFSYDITVSAEMTAVADVFVGPGLHMVQGVALNRDEFSDDHFSSSGLVHLAAPGTIDLAFPERSRLLMSKADSQSAAEYLAPGDIRGLSVNNSLVVLSQTVVTGTNLSSFDSRLGLVSDFLQAGATSVVASVWPFGDSETAGLMRDFYQELESSRDITEALLSARRMRLNSGEPSNFREWAGFQLYIR